MPISPPTVFCASLTAVDAADAAKVRRAVAHFRAGKSKAIPLAQLKNELGIA